MLYGRRSEREHERSQCPGETEPAWPTSPRRLGLLRAAAQPEPDRDLPHTEDGHRDPEQDGEHEHTRVLPGEHERPHEDVRRSCEPLDQPIVVAVERGPDELQDPVCEKRQAARPTDK